MSLESGELLLHYRLVEKAGEGGMGVVWRAVDTSLGRDVAIKVLPEGLSRDPVRLQRFEREARLLASLNHPNVATVHGLEQAGDERFLVMEFVVGRTIADLLAFGGPWKLDTALPLMRQMTSGLEAAHRKGIIHRDLKPANVQLSSDDRIKILDFGLAKVADELPAGPISADSPTWVRTPTMSGMIVGTMNYMSPEQIEGRALDPRSDLFQLGMIFFEMVTGRHPFHGKTPVDVQHAILREPPHLAELEAVAPEELVRIVAKLLEKDREYRYPDAGAVAVDLKTLHRASDPAWSSGSHSGVTARRPSGLRGPAIVAAAIVTAAAIGGVALWRSPWRTPPGPPATPSRLVPIVSSAGDGSTPSFSPDGNSVVFASNRGGNWDLWVSLVTGGNMVQVTDTPEQEFHPAWSPDGERVAFTRYPLDGTPSAVWVAPALGGAARKLVEDGSDPAWSPDGREIAFVRDAGGSSRILRIAIDARDGPRAVTPEEDGIFQRDPDWTPDGRSIVYARSLGGMSGRLMRVPATGGPAVPIVDDPDGVMSAQPAVTPDGRYVVHASDRGGTVNLWRIPIDGGVPERVTFGPGPDSSPEVSRDGRRIVYVNTRRDPRVVFVTAEGLDRDLADDLEGGVVWHPVLSPDGATIALSRKAPGEPWRIQTVPREGGTLTTVLDVEYDTLWPQFHPDGERLVFFTWPGRHRVGIVSLDGSEFEWLTGEDVECGYPAVSPDGAWLAYSRKRAVEDKTDIVIRPFDGGDERMVVEGGTVPVFSPDGRMLAFAGGRTPTGRIGVVALDGGQPRWLTETGTWPTWMPDGREIAYADRSSNGPQVARAVSVDGGEPRTLSTYAWPGTNFPFSIDPITGDILTTNLRGPNSSIWLAEYDTP